MKVVKAQEIITSQVYSNYSKLHQLMFFFNILKGNGDFQQQHKRFWLRAIWTVTSKIWSAPEKNI